VSLERTKRECRFTYGSTLGGTGETKHKIKLVAALAEEKTGTGGDQKEGATWV